MSDTGTAQLTEAMNRLWAKFLPQMQERVATLQKAAENATAGALSSVEQHAASSEAHKLAGVLGTFGLHEGTDLAREAEVLYAGPLDESVSHSCRLSDIAESLRLIIESRT